MAYTDEQIVGGVFRVQMGGGLTRNGDGSFRLTPSSGSVYPYTTKVSNNSGIAIAAGELLYVRGFDAANDCVYVGRAISSSVLTRADYIAIEAIADGATGLSTQSGTFTANTDGGTIGARIYASASTAGAVTRTRPTTANSEERVGKILTVSATGKVQIQLPPTDAPPADLNDDRFATLGTTRKMGGRDVGRVGTQHFYLTGVVADAQTVTFGTRIYEFDTTADPGAIVAGRVRVAVVADQTADAAITALVTAMNADASREGDAAAWAGNSDTTSGAHFVEKSLTGVNPALATTCVNGVVGAAATTGAAALANRDAFAFRRTIVAQDVTTLARLDGAAAVIGEIDVMGIPVTSEPSTYIVQVKRPNGTRLGLVADQTIEFDWVQLNANYWMLKCLDPLAVLAATDVIDVIAIS